MPSLSSPAMTLRELMGGGAPDVEITGLAYSTADVAAGSLFFCVPGFYLFVYIGILPSLK